MPTACEPWPGKTKAVFMPQNSGNRGAALGFARHHRPARQGERTQAIEEAGIEILAVNTEIHRTVAEALQRLPQPAQAHFTLAAHAIEIDFQRNDLLLAACLVDHIARRADDDGASHPAGGNAVDVEPEALVLRCTGARDGKLDIAVERIGEG